MKINFENKETILRDIDSIAELLSNKTILKINDTSYRIVDFEFYVYSANKDFQDPHVYKNSLQLQNGKLYFHGSGIDITVGDELNYAGILLRSVIKFSEDSDSKLGSMKEQFDGPHKVATELMSNLNSLNSHKPNSIDLIFIKDNDTFLYASERILKSKRIGLTFKKEDDENYFLNLPLRYIAIIPEFKQTIKNKEFVLSEQVANGALTEVQANKILGYTRKRK